MIRILLVLSILFLTTSCGVKNNPVYQSFNSNFEKQSLETKIDIKII
jgi:hypothetical protein